MSSFTGWELKPVPILIRYELAHRMQDLAIDSMDGAIPFAGTTWETDYEQKGLDSTRGRQVALAVKSQGVSQGEVAVGIQFVLENWSKDHYLLMPAAVYNGNRFHAEAHWTVDFCSSIAPHMPVTITRVPRLEMGMGPSEIQQKAGDFSAPVVAIFDPHSRKGFILSSDQSSNVGDYAWAVRENEERTKAVIELRAPGVRERQLYNGQTSRDRGISAQKGHSIEIGCWVDEFPCESIQELYDRFFEIWQEWSQQASAQQQISFSSCWNIQEKKYNRQNWVEEYGYYSVGMREVPSQDWQTGWVGGCNTLYGLIAEGNEETKSRALRTFDFLFDIIQAPTGLLHGGFSKGRLGGVSSMTRYSTDGLYFILKSYLWLENHGIGHEIKEEWKEGARELADGLVNLWKSEGQLGQRVDVESGKIMMGESANANLAVGALALASEYFNEPDYLVVANELADHYYKHYVAKGILNGGPGDMLTCPDSESTAAMVEAYVTLWEVTDDPRHLMMAEEAARQAVTWVMPYDFTFPEDCTFGQLDMRTAGTVFANVQNKHSAPGICSLSGAVLLKLSRATGNAGYLRLIQLIAHAIPQYMSRADRPIIDRRPGQRWRVMSPGWINERVNTSDWEVRCQPNEEIGVGEIFGGSTWSEVAMILTYAEVPGIYLNVDSKELTVLDHVEAALLENGKRLRIHNPTKFPCEVKVLVETAEQAQKKIGPLIGQDLPKINVAPYDTVNREVEELMVAVAQAL